MSDTLIERIRVIDARPLSQVFRPMEGLSKERVHRSMLREEKEQSTESIAVPEGDLVSEAFERGFKAAEKNFVVERLELQKLIAASAALQPEPSEELAVLIAETVSGLVAKIVGNVAIDRDWLADRARNAAALVSECDNARTIFVHPDDMIHLKGSELPLPIKADRDALRGSIRIDCSSGWIESGTALYLDALRVELGLQECSE
jgi:flagellar assembly protein FliH